jgi:hypothetical protein
VIFLGRGGCCPEVFSAVFGAADGSTLVATSPVFVAAMMSASVAETRHGTTPALTGKAASPYSPRIAE